MKLSNIEFTAFVGLDWADSKHDICVQAVGCEIREFDRFRHKVAAIDDVFSVPPRLIQNFLKTHLMRLRLISSTAQLITYT